MEGTHPVSRPPHTHGCVYVGVYIVYIGVNPGGLWVSWPQDFGLGVEEDRRGGRGESWTDRETLCM